jgi:hypothetical protein
MHFLDFVEQGVSIDFKQGTVLLVSGHAGVLSETVLGRAAHSIVGRNFAVSLTTVLQDTVIPGERAVFRFRKGNSWPKGDGAVDGQGISTSDEC